MLHEASEVTEPIDSTEDCYESISEQDASKFDADELFAPSNPTDDQYDCDVCGETYSPLSSLEAHIRSAHPNDHNIKCSQCNKEFNSSRNLKLHIKHVHDKIREYPCELCDQKFGQKNSALRHMIGVHKLKDGYVFADGQVFDALQFKRTSKCYCEPCDKFFSNTTAYKKHQNSKHTSYRLYYQCEICAKMIATKSSLADHMATVHHGERKHVCDICGKSFANPGIVKRHKLTIHKAVKAFTCDICGKDFTQSGNLKMHMANVHLKTRPHVCQYCGKDFSQKSNMKTHIRNTHSHLIDGASHKVEK